MSDGHEITPASRRSVRGFRKTLGAQGDEPRICPPSCTEDHDFGKTPGRDHWQAIPASGPAAPVCRKHRLAKIRQTAKSAFRCPACEREAWERGQG
jgi:hypothetical protein